MKKAEARKRGQIVPRGDGKYLIRVPLGTEIDTDGKLIRRTSSEVIRGTIADAKKALTKKLAELDTNMFVEPSKLTVETYCKQWLAGKTDIGVKTLNDYTHRLQKDIYPVIGRVRMDKLAPLQVQQMIAGLSARGLSPRTVQYSYTVIKAAFADAVEMGLLAKTPCRGVKLPKKAKTVPEVWDASEVQRFLAVDSPDRALWLTALTTGLRPEEYLALGWDQVDLDKGIISVTRALNEIGGGNYKVGDTKTDSSRRSITLPKETVETLRAHKRKQVAEMLEKGERYQRLGFVFAGRSGNFQDISAVRRRFKTCLATAQVKEIPLYNMRHTHATLLLTAGVHPKVVQERLGHSSITVTMDTYSHVLMSLQTQTAETLSGILFAPVAIAL